MKLLLLGANGQVGWELRRSLAPLGELVALGKSDADLTMPASLSSIVGRLEPDFIVNAAAYTAVDRAEKEPEIARLINADSVAALAQIAAQHNSWLIHYSTDYVFDGAGVAPRKETDRVGPLNVYGETKRDGERSIVDSGCKYIIFRTSWVSAARGTNFVKTILRLATNRSNLSVVADQWGAPTSAELIADITALAIRQITADDDQSARGIFHLAASGTTNWHEYACYVLDRAYQLNVPLLCTSRSIAPVTTAEYPTAARRPLNSRLNTDKIRMVFKVTPPDWRDGVGRVLTEIVELQRWREGGSS